MKKLYIYLLSSLSLCMHMSAQTSSGLSYDQNFIRTINFQTADRDVNKSIDVINYYDGLGRPMQSVQRAITPQRQDLVATQEYDPFGRESTQWLPSVSKNNGAFVPTVSIPSNGWDTYQDSAYSRPVYEASPLNRVLEQYGPGKEWYANKKRITTDYLTNNDTDLSCILYTVSGTRQNPALKKSGIYNTGELYVTKLTNEDGQIAYEFKDKLGQVVLTRQMNKTTSLNTYYVYDDYGNLCFVLPPKVAETKDTSVDSEPMQQYAYLYRYDNRNRCIEKKLPGADWTYYVYDQADRLIFSQDGEQRLKGEGLFLIPDAFERPVLSGIARLDIEAMRSKLENTVVTAVYNAANFSNKGYDIKNLELTAPVILSVNYYDNYDFLSLDGFTKLGYQAKSDYGTMYTSNTGRLTGNITALLDTVNSYLYTATYYNLKGQAIQNHSTNHLGGMESSFMAYNFVGQPTDILSIHTAQLNGVDFKTEEHLINQYDHAGRLTKTTHSLNGGDVVTLAENIYDELGRLQNTKSGSDEKLKSNYDYTIRSWTKTINNPLFTENLKYTYSGNIQTMDWTQNQKDNQYIFKYDDLSRLESTNYSGDNRDYSTNYTYDWHGNVETIQRNGKLDNDSYGLVDNMSLAYSGNQLKNITDQADRQLKMRSTDFKDQSSLEIEYSYNRNGAMSQDLNKGIESITYNSLNLPRELTIQKENGKATNLYTYTATGQKLRVIHRYADMRQLLPMSGTTLTNSAENVTTQKDYVGNKIYEDGKLKQIQLGNGYIEEGNYYFYIKDHLGNNRIVADINGEVQESNEYYPFGGLFAKSSNDPDKQDFKYNGKEYDSMHGLNLYDYAARHYDPANIRFTTMDPMAEKYYSISPYVYVANNPMKFIDPTGMNLSTDVKKNDDGTYTVTGGKLDGDKNIYVTENGKRTGEVIGQTATETSFYYSDQDEWLGTIDPNDLSGAKFLKDFKEKDPSITYYMDNAKTNQYYDFKVTNGSNNIIYTNSKDHYRGMPLGRRKDTGITIYSSARDIGNIAAGYIVGRYGYISWENARTEFDKLESKQKGSSSVEGISTQNAQKFGYISGQNDFYKESRITTTERFINTIPGGINFIWQKIVK